MPPYHMSEYVFKEAEHNFENQNFIIHPQKSMNEHKQVLDPDNPRDFIDIYLTEIRKNSNNPDTTFTGKWLF